MRSLLNLSMTLSGCSIGNSIESNSKLESSFSSVEFLILGEAEIFLLLLLFLESRSHQNFRIPGIRSLA